MKHFAIALAVAALSAQRSLHAGQQTLVTLRQEELANRVTLHNALGGGRQRRTSAEALP